MNIHITNELLDSMEKSAGISQIVEEDSFNKLLNFTKAIVYISVDWAVQERFSLYIMYTIINDLKVTEIPIFKIDCSNQENRYIEDWLTNQLVPMEYVYSNGYGETLLIKYGQIIDFIKYPGALGIEKTKIKIEKWLIESTTDFDTV